MRVRSDDAFFVVLLIVAILLLGKILLPIWKPLFLAAVIAVSLAGYQRRLSAAWGDRRWLAGAALTLAVVVLLLLPLVGILTIAIDQAHQAIVFVHEATDEEGLQGLTRQLPDWLEQWVNRGLAYFPQDLDTLAEQAAQGGRWAAGGLAAGVAALGSLLLQFALMTIALYFLLVDGPRLAGWLQGVLPLRSDQTGVLFRDFRAVSRALLGSNLATGVTQTFVAGIGYVVAGVPLPFFFVMLTFVASFIPSIGTSIVSLPVAALMAIMGKPGWAVFLLAWSLLVVGLVDNLLRPYLMRGPMQLHGAVVFFALIGGVSVFGAIGLIVGPLVLAFFLTMVRLWRGDFPEVQPSAADP